MVIKLIDNFIMATSDLLIMQINCKFDKIKRANQALFINSSLINHYLLYLLAYVQSHLNNVYVIEHFAELLRLIHHHQ